MREVVSRAAIWLPAVFAAAGIALFAYGTNLPIYTDFEAARALTGPESCDDNGVVSGWHESMAALRTWRYPFMQGGISLVLASVSFWAIALIFRVPHGLGLRTPNSRWTYFVLGLGVLVLSWFSHMHSLQLDQRRDVFPWCADTIIIPMFSLTLFYFALALVCLLVGIALSARFAGLPVSLFQWRNDQPLKSWLVTVPFALIGAFIGFLGVDGGYHSTFIGTPAAVVALYLVEATRSAILAKPTDLTGEEPSVTLNS